MSISKRTRNNRMTVAFYITKENAKCAKQIEVICEHNGWEPVALKPQKNGTFRGSITVDRHQQSQYQFKYKLTFEDGNCCYDNDPKADGYIDNNYGGNNSIFTCI